MQQTRTYYERKERPVIYCDKCGKEISDDGYEERSLIGFLCKGSIRSRTQLVHRDYVRNYGPCMIGAGTGPSINADDAKFADELLFRSNFRDYENNVFDLCDDCFKRFKEWVKEK